MITILAQNWFSNLDPPIPVQNKYIHKLGEITWDFNNDNLGDMPENDDYQLFYNLQDEMNQIATECNDDVYEEYYMSFDIPVYVRFNRGICNITDYQIKHYAWESVSMIMTCVNDYFQIYQDTNPNYDVIYETNDIIYVAIVNIIPKNKPYAIFKIPHSEK